MTTTMTNWTTLKNQVAKILNDTAYFDARAKHATRNLREAAMWIALKQSDDVRFGEAQHRVRKYNQEVVSVLETTWGKDNPGPKSSPHQRTFFQTGNRPVKKTIGRNPGAATYETWVTASIGRYTASGPTKEIALCDLASLCA